ncbi:MAG TPA: lipid A biosynthesis acyltransferase [Thermoanaerobaculia bacterium]|nr:lipid A biosynthesis acyltransferase [Thermoanaerobaculia bacterium]
MAGPKLRAFRERALLRALGIVSFIGRRIPLRRGQAIGRFLGSLAWTFARGERRKAMRNIEIAFPEWTDDQRRRVIRAMFRHLGTSLFEIVWLPNIDELNERTRFEGTDRVVDLVRGGRSVVVFTGHCGNWEWLAYSVGKRAPVTVLQRERTERGLGDFIVDIRKQAGIDTIDRGSTAAGRELIRAMRKPGFVAFLIDQSIRAESAKVPFFGKPALTPIGPATLAIRTEAYAVAAFIERLDDGTHLIRFQEPLETKRGDDPIELTARMTRAIEEQVRRVPEQWVWMHDRWRDRPKWDVGSTAL